MKQLYDDTCNQIGKLLTRKYSTSFSIGIRLFDASIRPKIYSLYAFVRLADEIVDSFHDYNQRTLFDHFNRDYQDALDTRISINPVLNAFQDIVHRYKLHDLVNSFLHSMELDLTKVMYTTEEEYKNYIYGSADVVGLMCLKIFLEGDEKAFNRLSVPAIRLGSAFQKVNFLRDFSYDSEVLGRIYFPNVCFNEFDEKQKNELITEINQDFKEAFSGIKQLPDNCRLGVYVAFQYYRKLLKKLSKKEPREILQNRTRISNWKKMYILQQSVIRYKLNVL